MRFAMRGPAVTTLLTIGTPAFAAPALIPCEGCALPPSLAQRPFATVRKRLTTLPYEELFRAGHVAAKGLNDRWSAHLFQAGESGFSLETVRRIASRAARPETEGAPRDKLSSGSLTLRYTTGLGAADGLSLGLSAGMEKRRFALDLAGGHQVRGQSVGLVAIWSHGSAWRLESGYRADFGGRQASMLERGIELAEGAPRSQRGAWTALSYTMGQPDEAGSVSIGVRAHAVRMAETDRIAIGAPSRADSRIALTASFRFR